MYRCEFLWPILSSDPCSFSFFDSLSPVYGFLGVWLCTLSLWVTKTDTVLSGFFFFLLLFILFFPLCFTSPLCPVFTELGKVNTDAVPIADSSSWRLSWLNCTFVDTVILRKLTAVKRWSAHALVYKHRRKLSFPWTSPESFFFFFCTCLSPEVSAAIMPLGCSTIQITTFLREGFPWVPLATC